MTSTHPSAPSQEKSCKAAADTGQLTVSHCPSYHCGASQSHYQQFSQIIVKSDMRENSLWLHHPEQHIRNKTRTTGDHFYSPGILSSSKQRSHSPSNQDPRDLTRKGLSHLTASYVCDTVKSQAHEGGVAAGQVILDGVVDETDQLTVAVHQHRDEQVALEKQK